MKSKSVRAAGIVLAVILGVAALFYLGGLISQLTIGYQKWLADGGMTGKATMGTIYFSPLACWRSAMTGSGLKCTLFTAVLAGGLFVFVRLQNRFGSNDYDPRNFTRSKRGTYGTSGWMSEKEMRSVLEVAGPERAKGIILGKTERGSVICLPEDTRLNKHIAVFGASGTKKSRGVIRPAIFQSIRRNALVKVGFAVVEHVLQLLPLLRMLLHPLVCGSGSFRVHGVYPVPIRLKLFIRLGILEGHELTTLSAFTKSLQFWIFRFCDFSLSNSRRTISPGWSFLRFGTARPPR